MTLPHDRFVLQDNIPRSSCMTINIAGFTVYLYGVDELTVEQARDTTVLFHIHGRTRTYKDAEAVAHQVLHDLRQQGKAKRGLVVASFDNRNHGQRAIDNLSIKDWKGGNPRHAQDMLSTIDGIVADVQTVMTFLASYVDGIFSPTQFIISGVSLGGHVSWDVLARDDRVGAAVIIVGSPNLTGMLIDRLGGYKSLEDVPDGTKEWPASISRLYQDRDENLTRLKAKKILILNGALDTLVPSRFTRPWVKSYGAQNAVTFVEQQDVGHAISVEMVQRMVDWLSPFLNDS